MVSCLASILICRLILHLRECVENAPDESTRCEDAVFLSAEQVLGLSTISSKSNGDYQSSLELNPGSRIENDYHISISV